MITTRWILHCETCGYLSRPEYPGQWIAERTGSFKFRHKRDAIRAVTSYSPANRQLMAVEPLHSSKDDVSD